MTPILKCKCYMEFENKIIIRSVFKITKCKMQPAINPKTGRYADHVRSVDSNGDMIYVEGDKDKKAALYPIAVTDVIELYDGKVFDLNDKHDLSEWEAIKYSPLIAEERFAKNEKGEYVIDGNSEHYGIAEFYIDRPGRDAQISNNKAQRIHNAQGYIFGDSRDNLYIKARVLGAKLNGLPYDEVLEFMLSEAKKDPDKIIELYTGNDFRLRVLLTTALDKGVILERNGGYIYGKVNIGLTEESVLLWLKQPQNKDLLDSIMMECYPENFSKEAKEEKKTPFKRSEK